jgi:hypothetical protein
MLDMVLSMSDMLQVHVNKTLCELDTMDNTAAIPKKSVSKPFEYVLVVLISCDIICTDEQIQQLQMD